MLDRWPLSGHEPVKLATLNATIPSSEPSVVYMMGESDAEIATIQSFTIDVLWKQRVREP